MQINFEKFQVDEEKREITFSCASPTPYQRYDESANIIYDQILVIDESAVDLARLNNSAPLLFNHDTDKLLGMVEKAWIVEDRIYVRVRFSANDFFADRIYKDILDGLIKNVSIGYVVQGYEDKKENGKNIRYVTKWMIYETSIVSIAADPTVGIRSLEIKENIQMEENQEKQVIQEQAVEQTVQEVQEQVVEQTEQAVEQKIEQQQTDQVQELKKEIETLKAENEKMQRLLAEDEKEQEVKEQVVDDQTKEEIEKIAEDFNIPQQEVRSAVEKKMSVKDFKEQIKQKTFNVKSKEDKKMNRNEFRNFLAERNFDKPFVMRDFSGFAPKALVATETLPLVAMLEKKLGLQGYRTIGGLNSQIELPIQKSRIAVNAVGVNDASTDSNPTFEKLTLAPNKFTASVVIGKQMLVASNSDVEAFVIDSITRQLAYSVQAYMLGKVADGAGKEINYSNLNAFTWDDALAFEAAIGGYNVTDANFVMGTSARATLKGIEKAQGTAKFICEDNQINGYAVNVSGCVADSNIYFGAWDRLILAQFGEGLEIIVDPYTESRSGNVVVVGSICVDAGVDAPQAFAVGKVQA